MKKTEVEEMSLKFKVQSLRFFGKKAYKADIMVEEKRRLLPAPLIENIRYQVTRIIYNNNLNFNTL